MEFRRVCWRTKTDLSRTNYTIGSSEYLGDTGDGLFSVRCIGLNHYHDVSDVEIFLSVQPFFSFGKTGQILPRPAYPETVSEVLDDSIFFFGRHNTRVKKVVWYIRIFVTKKKMLWRNRFGISRIYAHLS